MSIMEQNASRARATGLLARLFGARPRPLRAEPRRAPAVKGPGAEAEWRGEPLLATALADLAAGRAAPIDRKLRLAAASFSAPIAARLAPEALGLAAAGAKLCILLGAEPQADREIALLAELGAALGAADPSDYLRIADFAGSESCREQAMIGDRLYWAGEPLGDGAPACLAEGALYDLTRSTAAADAARLRFAAAWRLAAAPGVALAHRLSP